MANSVAVCTVADNGTNLQCKRVLWEDYLSLDLPRRTILVAVFWQQSPEPAPPNQNNSNGFDLWSIDFSGSILKLRQCRTPGGGTASSSIDVLFDVSGEGDVRPWPLMLVDEAISAAVASDVSILGYMPGEPNYDDLLASAKILAVNTLIST